MNQNYIRSFRTIFMATVVIQSLHMVEHIAQVIQKFGLGWKEAHGIIGVLDLEWVHFIYNTALLITLYILFFKYSRLLKAGGNVLYGIFVADVVLQSYHVIEHLVKINQHLQTGQQGTPGILGNFVNPILFHFWMNLAVLALITIPFVGLRIYRKADTVSTLQGGLE